MGDVPSAVNDQAAEVDRFIQSAVFDVAVNAFCAYAATQFPFLGWPVLSTLFRLLVRVQAQGIYRFLARAATFTVIDMQTDVERARYQQAVVGLHVAHASGDPAVVARAQDQFRSSLGQLVHFDGSAAV